MRRQSVFGSPKSSAGPQPSTSAASKRIVHQCYLLGLRVQRYCSDDTKIKHIRVTIRSDALFMCSDRDGTIQRVVPTSLITSATYFPLCRRLRISVSGEHDVVLTAARLADTQESDRVVNDDDDDVNYDQEESRRVPSSFMEENQISPAAAAATSQQPAFITEVIDEDDLVNHESLSVSRTIENIVEALDRALEHHHKEFFDPSMTSNSSPASSVISSHHHQSTDDDNTSTALSASSTGTPTTSSFASVSAAMAKQFWYRTFAHYRVEFSSAVRAVGSPLAGSVASLDAAKAASSAVSSTVASRVRVLANVQDTLDPRQCHLHKAMDYVSIAERLELRRRGSKKLITASRLTVDYWDVCIANPPSAVAKPIELADTNPLSAMLQREIVVMQGEIVVNRFTRGLDEVELLHPSSDVSAQHMASPLGTIMLVATSRRLLVVAMPSKTATSSSSAAPTQSDAPEVVVCCPVASIHSLSVFTNEWPPRRLEVRFLGANAAPSVLDFSLALPSSPSSSSASSAQQPTTTANVVIVAEFIARLAAREGVLVHMAQFKPLVADTAVHRLQQSIANSQQAASSSSGLASALSSMFLPQRTNNGARSPNKSGSGSPTSSIKFDPSSAAQSLANTIAGGSDALRNVATSILHTLTPGQRAVSPASTTTANKNTNVHGGFDAALSALQKRAGSPATAAAPAASFFSVPVTGRAASAARNAEIEQQAHQQQASIARRSSFANNNRGGGVETSLLMGNATLTGASVSVPSSTAGASNNNNSAVQPTTSRSFITGDSLHSPAASNTAAARINVTASASTIRRPLPAISAINDYCRPSVTIRHAFDDGGVRKVLLARYVARVASDEDIRRGEKHAPRILILSEHFNGADQRLTIADRRFVARARLPYAAITKVEGFADDALTLTFSASRGSNMPSEEQTVSFVLDDRKHHSIGDHPATRLADIISVVRQSIALNAEVFSYENFSAYRTIAKSFLSKAMVAASTQAAAVLQRSSSHGSLTAPHQRDSDDGRTQYQEAPTLHVPEQYTLPADAFPPPDTVPVFVRALAASQLSTTNTSTHLQTAFKFDEEPRAWRVAYCREVLRLASNKVRWIPRTMAVIVPPTQDEDLDIICRPSNDGILIALFDEKGIVHRRIDGRSILNVNVCRDAATHKRPQEPQGVVLDFAIHGERRLVVRFPPDQHSSAPLKSRSPQTWEVNWGGPPPQVVVPLTSKALPTAAMRAMQFVNLLRRCCAFEFGESYDERKNWENGNLDMPDEATSTPPSSPSTSTPSATQGRWSFDPNEVVFMDRRASMMRKDYFARTPVRNNLRSNSIAPASFGNNDESTLPSSSAASATALLSLASPRAAEAEDLEPYFMQLGLEEHAQRKRITHLAKVTFDEAHKSLESTLQDFLDEAKFQQEEADWFHIAAERLDRDEVRARDDIDHERLVYMLTATEEVHTDTFMSHALSMWFTHDNVGNITNRWLQHCAREKQRLVASKATWMDDSCAMVEMLHDEERVRSALERVEAIRRSTRLHQAMNAWVELCLANPLTQAAEFTKEHLHKHEVFCTGCVMELEVSSVAAQEEVRRHWIESLRSGDACCCLAGIHHVAQLQELERTYTADFVCDGTLTLHALGEHQLGSMHNSVADEIGILTGRRHVDNQAQSLLDGALTSALEDLQTKASFVMSSLHALFYREWVQWWAPMLVEIKTMAAVEAPQDGAWCTLLESFQRETMQHQHEATIDAVTSGFVKELRLFREMDALRHALEEEENATRMSWFIDFVTGEKERIFEASVEHTTRVFLQDHHVGSSRLQLVLEEQALRVDAEKIEHAERASMLSIVETIRLELRMRQQVAAEALLNFEIEIAEPAARALLRCHEKYAMRKAVTHTLLQEHQHHTRQLQAAHGGAVAVQQLAMCTEPQGRDAIDSDEHTSWANILFASSSSRATFVAVQRLDRELQVASQNLLMDEEESFLALTETLQLIWFAECRLRVLLHHNALAACRDEFEEHVLRVKECWAAEEVRWLLSVFAMIALEGAQRSALVTDEESIHFSELYARDRMEAACVLSYEGLCQQMSFEVTNVRVLAYRHRITQRRVALLLEEEAIERASIDEGCLRGMRSLLQSSVLLSTRLHVAQEEEDRRVQWILAEHAEYENGIYAFALKSAHLRQLDRVRSEEAHARQLIAVEESNGYASPQSATVRGQFDIMTSALAAMCAVRVNEGQIRQALRRQSEEEAVAAYQRQVAADLVAGRTRYQHHRSLHHAHAVPHSQPGSQGPPSAATVPVPPLVNQGLASPHRSPPLLPSSTVASRTLSPPTATTPVRHRPQLPLHRTDSGLSHNGAQLPPAAVLLVGAGAGAGAVPQQQLHAAGATDYTSPSSRQPSGTFPLTAATKIRIRWHDSFLQLQVHSEDMVARIVKKGRGEMKRAAPQGEDINRLSAQQFSDVFPLAVFCHCQSERFRDVLAIRPASLVDAVTQQQPLPVDAVVVQVRTSHFQWVTLDSEAMLMEWVARGVSPLVQADRAVAREARDNSSHADVHHGSSSSNLYGK